MALNFGAGVSEYIFSQDTFLGVDFSTQPSKVSPKRSPDSKNMLINQNGYVEKRTGYRCVSDGIKDENGNTIPGSINGIFEYVCPDSGGTYHFIHIADKLYKCTLSDGNIQLGPLMLEGLKDKKSRGFAFGGDFFIIGAGYIRIGYDKFTGSLCYGFVNKACTVNDRENAPVVISNNAGKDYCTDNMYKKLETSIDTEDGKKHYLIAPEFADGIRIVSIDGVGQFKAKRDSEGVYITTSIPVSKKCAVTVAYNSGIYAPTVVTGRTQVRVHTDGNEFADPKYTGETLEAANLASGLRKIDFYIASLDTTNAEYYRLYTGYSDDTLIRLWRNGSLMQGEGEEYTVQGGCVNLYACSPGDIITAEFVTGGTHGIIDGCDIYALYGGSNDTRVFLAGNEKYIARDYASGLYDGTYFSDLMYTDVGSEASAIVGYHKLHSSLVILKDGKGNDSTQYLRTFSLTTDGEGNASVLFSVKQGSASFAAANASSLKTVEGTPMFLGEDGVYALRGTNVEDQNNSVRVSQTIDERLKKETNLKNAVCASYDKKYYLFTDERAYICSPEMGYEWFYFDSLPHVSCVWIKDAVMYFGADDGRIYRFMNADEKEAYYDNVPADGKTENAKAIEAVWELPVTALGDYTSYKTIRNCYITCMPHRRSSVKVYYNTNEDLRENVLAANIDLFSFEDVDFNRFTFNSISAPFVFATGVKVKNVYVFGLRLENNTAGEPFGFLALSVKYRKGKFVK